MIRRYGLLLCIVVTMLLPLPAMAGAWDQISQAQGMSESWEQIVQESPFALGAVREVESPGGRAYRQVDFGTYPSIDGSTVSVPMALGFARQHLNMAEADLTGFVFFSTTHHAYENLILRQPNGAAALVSRNAVMDAGHPVDIIIVTEPSDEELAMAEAAGVELVVRPVCHDAFVFIVREDNPVDSLTVEQVRGIYSGEISDWAEVGWTEEAPIIAYQRNKNSGSQTAMENLVMQGTPMRREVTAFHFLNEMSALVSRISEYGEYAGIGYTYKYYIDALYPSDAVKVLAIDGVYPSAENIRSGAYPFTTSYYGVIRKEDEDAVGGQFLGWMLSEEGQRCIAQAGYIPFEASK